MDLDSLSLRLERIAPALANHLWQSTLFVIFAGALTLALRTNQARARYWLWLAASVKFLLPFSLFVALGAHLMKQPKLAMVQTVLHAALEQAGQSFPDVSAPMVSPAHTFTARQHLIVIFPIALTLVWAAGFLFVLALWAVRWSRVARFARSARPLTQGREWEALCRVRGNTRIDLLATQGSQEPGVFGILRPVLLWPERIAASLEDSHLEAILAHEICHVRRRDNLTAVLHMLVEALFWFHPPVWWIGARLLDERERTCDEAVLQAGSTPKVYAESILRVCQFSIESTILCVSGVSGANHTKRVVNIMSGQVPARLNFARKLMLGTAATVTLTLPVAVGALDSRAGLNLPLVGRQTVLPNQEEPSEVASVKQAKRSTFLDESLPLTNVGRGSAESYSPKGGLLSRENRSLAALEQPIEKEREGLPQTTTPGAKVPEFEVVSIRRSKSDEGPRVRTLPDGYSIRNMSLKVIIGNAYGVKQELILGAPKWTESMLFDIQAKWDDSVVEALQKLPPEQRSAQIRLMLQPVLADRFHLRIKRVEKELPIYELVVAKNGPRVKEADPHNEYANGVKPPEGLPNGLLRQVPGQLIGQGIPISMLALNLQNQVSRNIVDKTGLIGKYDITLNWSPALGSTSADSDSSESSIFTAIQEQLGLRLQASKGVVVTLMIDQVEQPSEN